MSLIRKHHRQSVVAPRLLHEPEPILKMGDRPPFASFLAPVVFEDRPEDDMAVLLVISPARIRRLLNGLAQVNRLCRSFGRTSEVSMDQNVDLIEVPAHLLRYASRAEIGADAVPVDYEALGWLHPAPPVRARAHFGLDHIYWTMGRPH